MSPHAREMAAWESSRLASQARWPDHRPPVEIYIHRARAWHHGMVDRPHLRKAYLAAILICRVEARAAMRDQWGIG